ncbi:G-coupled receptor -like protein [Brachionus plicatilis]|uniref:G-coupled receptor-like protein n=1 Tax=Brachionus plicatilis TaxID=10195 RepID=A0A3M7QRV6_BRAPC|nr:G-coupled receptor -like protein [Brachionus plicatilis]
MNTTQKDSRESALFAQIVSYLPLIVIFLAITGNTACFFIFRFSKEFKNISSMVFLSFVAIFGILSQFIWNLNHFLQPNFDFRIEYVSDFTCKFFMFLQYFSLQAIGILLSIMCVDRFVTIMSTPGSIYSRLPFSTVKSSYIWSLSIIIILFLLNSHILIFNGNYRHVRNTNNITTSEIINGTLVSKVETIIEYQECYWYNADFRLYPTWDHVNLGLYNFFPFTMMLIFNVLLITKTLMLNSSIKSSNNKEQIKSIIKKRRLTISILAITFGYIIMTLPVTIMTSFYFYYFFSLPNGLTYLSMADSFGFLFHATLFFNCIATNIKFRRYVIRALACSRRKKQTESTANSITKTTRQ